MPPPPEVQVQVGSPLADTGGTLTTGLQGGRSGFLKITVYTPLTVLLSEVTSTRICEESNGTDRESEGLPERICLPFKVTVALGSAKVAVMRALSRVSGKVTV